MLRSAAIEQYQLGVEATAGDEATTAGERFLSITKLTPKAMEPKSRHRGGGSEVPNGESQEKVWSEWEGEAPLCYKTLHRIFNACLGNQAASPYTYVPNAFGVDAIKTLVIEKGSAAGAEKAFYCVVKGFRLRFTKKDASINFSLFGRKLQRGEALTASPTKIACIPVDPKRVNFYLGTDEEGLALVPWQEIELTVGDRWAPHFEGNSANESFDEPAKVASEHTLKATLTLSVAAVADLIAAAEAKEIRFARIQATSALEIAEDEFYDLQITAAAFVDTPDPSGENEGVVTAVCNFVLTYDADFAAFLKIILTNAPAP